MKLLFKKSTINIAALFVVLATVFAACTKYGKGYLSPNVQYAVNQFTITRGRVAESYSLVTDGSSIPMNIKWTHIYDSLGNIVDTLFSKTYPVAVWTAAYDPTTDTTYASVFAKQAVENLPPIVVNQANGTLEANSGTYNIPPGTYTLDLEVDNSAGSETLKKIIQVVILDGKQLETSPEQGAFSNSILVAGTATGAGALFNGSNNPFDSVIVTRFADTPNVLILKFSDRNGVPFDPSKGEVAKRPNSGLNPTPPFLQNLQDYAPDTYEVSDTAISIKYPLVPFPIQSLGNGYNMYYRIPTAFVHIDKTSAWSSNAAGSYYLGDKDSHYQGVYADGLYDAAVRVPMRVWYHGSYEISVKVLNLTHK